MSGKKKKKKDLLIALSPGKWQTRIDCTLEKPQTIGVSQGRVTRSFPSSGREILQAGTEVSFSPAFSLPNDKAVRWYRPIKVLASSSLHEASSSHLITASFHAPHIKTTLGLNSPIEDHLAHPVLILESVLHHTLTEG